MDIFNSLNLNGNNITSATLNDTVIGTNTTTTAGAIKYNSGSLSYYNGSTWITVGTGSGETTEVNGFFNLSDGSTTYSVTVSPRSASRTVSFTSSNSGIMLISMMDNNVSRTLTVPTTYIKTTGDITISTEYTGGHNISITHGLNSRNLIVQVWYRKSNESEYELAQADVSTTSVNAISVHVEGDSYAGVYRVVIFKAYEESIAAGSITSTGQGSQRN